MHIEFVEIANFRKLLSIRIDFSEKTTLFVGANNSGKTSAMAALRMFLLWRTGSFDVTDITLCHWSKINEIGEIWLQSAEGKESPPLMLDEWTPFLPTLDLWLEVASDELHHVRSFIPALDWAGGRLGVRLRLEPKQLDDLYTDFVKAAAAAKATAAAAADEGATGGAAPLTVWPPNMVEFLRRRLNRHFDLRAYTLDPTKIVDPENSIARPQATPADATASEKKEFERLIRVHEVTAQRGFGEQAADGGDAPTATHRLSDQLRTYYERHLDPTQSPDPQDIKALRAIEDAQNAFNDRLTVSFHEALQQVSDLGYPGVTDPRPRVATSLKPSDGLRHSAAITFEVDTVAAAGPTAPLHLPENRNGLGYQNLISMIFRLMSFRDEWMRKGKADDQSAIEPLHLVLIEEPEAHLHAQVQQVFIRRAYEVLRNHTDLGESKTLRTQLIVSTHSSHVAHETPFSWLRYFRRVPAGWCGSVPVSVVVNMSTVFGAEKETAEFVTRYLRAQHSDLFFADAAILVEGSAERMVLPNLIHKHHPFLAQRYITILEIGGSHAKQLAPLLEHLELLTLIVTDIDTASDGEAARPQRGMKQVTKNPTLKSWIPAEDSAEVLFDLPFASKKKPGTGPYFEIRVAYQYPVDVRRPGAAEDETAYPYTFEDALALENLEFFSKLAGHGLAAKFRNAIATADTVAGISDAMFSALRNGSKAELALDVLSSTDFDMLKVPRYIQEALTWLTEQLTKKQAPILAGVGEPTT